MKLIKKILKLASKIILIILVLSIVICLCIIPYDNMARSEIMEMSINNVDLSKLEDGQYTGHYKNGLRNYEVEVTIKDNTITDIKSINNSPSNGYSNELFDKVIGQQQINVDTISGATVTSKIILKSIENALAQDN